MSGLFVSYRREDSRGDVGRLTKDLRDYLDGEQIFRDIDTVAPGVDFVKAISTAVGSCSVLIAVIGPNWLTVRDKNDHFRLEDPDDYVRLEIEVALSREIRVIPVLVGGADMPKRGELPESLSPLAHRQSHELSETRWDFDVESLAKELIQIPGLKRRKSVKPDVEREEKGRFQTPVTRVGRFVGAAVLSTMGILFLLAGLIEGQALAFLWAVVFLGGAYWLYARR